MARDGANRQAGLGQVCLSVSWRQETGGAERQQHTEVFGGWRGKHVDCLSALGCLWWMERMRDGEKTAIVSDERAGTARVKRHVGGQRTRARERPGRQCRTKRW